MLIGPPDPVSVSRNMFSNRSTPALSALPHLGLRADPISRRFRFNLSSHTIAMSFLVQDLFQDPELEPQVAIKPSIESEMDRIRGALKIREL